MNSLEQQLHYPLAHTLPERGQSQEIAPGIQWIRMALPFALNHINLWLLRDNFEGREGWTVVDCCIASEDAKVQWEQIFTHALQGLPILRVLVTHMHPDHLGLAHWLCSRWNAPLWISATDYYAAHVQLQGDVHARSQRTLQFLMSQGLQNPDIISQLQHRGSYYPGLVPQLPDHFHRLMDGMRIHMGGRDWQCIAGYGHAPEHMALYCADAQVLISGDMVLPRISTNISVFEIEPTSNPLALFLESLEKMRVLPADTLILPSHGKPFQGLHTRIDQLQAHHQERLEEVEAAATQRPCSSADIVPLMFKRPLDAHQQTFALGEAAAHLHYLWTQGKLSRAREADGIYRYRRSVSH